jgi:hypothetical protein
MVAMRIVQKVGFDVVHGYGEELEMAVGEGGV